MKSESDNIDDYLRATEIIDWDNLNVLAKAKEIVEGVADNVAKIKYLFEWVRDKIPHSQDIDSNYETIFTDPDPNVVGVLKRFEDRNEMWPYLPNKRESITY